MSKSFWKTYKLRKIRKNAFRKQNGRCFYCEAPMWMKNPEKFAKNHGLSLEEINKFQCTAEHLIARCDGGKDTNGNIVAACRFCNGTRHRGKIALNHSDYKIFVQKNVRSNRWHEEVRANAYE